jgi:hypothetical protein
MNNLSPALVSTLTKYLRYLTEAPADEYTQGTIDGFKEAIRLLDIKLPEVNA